MDSNQARQCVIRFYFRKGYSYKTILECLKVRGISCSLRTLKRILQRNGWKRRVKLTTQHLQHIKSIILVQSTDCNRSNCPIIFHLHREKSMVLAAYLAIGLCGGELEMCMG